MNIQNFNLSQNELSSIELKNFLKWLYLQKLDLSHNSLKFIDFTPLKTSKWLEILSIHDNSFEGLILTPLEECPSLKSVLFDDGILLVSDFKHPRILPPALEMIERINIKNHPDIPGIHEKRTRFIEAQKEYEKQLESKYQSDITQDLLINEITDEKYMLEEDKNVIEQKNKEEADIKPIELINSEFSKSSFKEGHDIVLSLEFKNNQDSEQSFTVEIMSSFDQNPHFESPIYVIQPRMTKKCGPYVLGRIDRSSPKIPIRVAINNRNRENIDEGTINITIKRDMRRLVLKILSNTFKIAVRAV